MYIAELERGLWIAPWSGDPGRTKLVENARAFKTRSTAWRAIEKVQKIRPFKNADVIDLYNETKPDDKLKPIIDIMKAISEQADDTIWYNDGTTVFERLWSLYLECAGEEADLLTEFPECA